MIANHEIAKAPFWFGGNFAGTGVKGEIQ